MADVFYLFLSLVITHFLFFIMFKPNLMLYYSILFLLGTLLQTRVLIDPFEKSPIIKISYNIFQFSLLCFPFINLFISLRLSGWLLYLMVPFSMLVMKFFILFIAIDLIKLFPLLTNVKIMPLLRLLRRLQLFLVGVAGGNIPESMLDIARLDINNHNLSSALIILTALINKCPNLNEPEIEGKARNIFCDLLFRTGSYAEVIEQSRQVLAIASKYNDLKLKRSAYKNLGNANEKLGTEYYSQAKEFYENALQIDILLQNKLDQASDYNNLGNILEKLKDFENAVNMYEKALLIIINFENKSGQCTIYTNLGALHQSINNFKQAIKYQNKCLKLSQEIKDEESETNACLNLGYCYFAINDFQTALNFFQAALPIAQKINDREREVKSLKGSADSYLALNFPEKAKFYYQQIIPHLEIMEYGLGVKERRSLIKQYLDIYQSLVDSCIKTGDFNAAFFYAETSRNRYLVERLAKHDAPLPENLPINLSKQIETAKLLERNTLQAYTDGLSKNLEQDQITELSIKWSEAKRSLENLYSQVVEIDPEFIAKTKVYPISFTEVQSLLPPATAVLEFFFIENKLVTMVILPGAEAPLIPKDLCLIVKHIYLESIAKAWISDIAAEAASKKDSGIEETIQDLPARIDRISELLKFNNLLDYIPPEIKHLVVVPHNYLHLFPIHALWIDESQRLIDRFSVEYTPSLLIWKICHSRQRNHWRFIGIENPTQDKDLIFAKAET